MKSTEIIKQYISDIDFLTEYAFIKIEPDEDFFDLDGLFLEILNALTLNITNRTRNKIKNKISNYLENYYLLFKYDFKKNELDILYKVENYLTELLTDTTNFLNSTLTNEISKLNILELNNKSVVDLIELNKIIEKYT